MTKLIAVVLTMLRPIELEALLSSLEIQKHRPDSILVVENTPHRETAEVVARYPLVRHIVSKRNLGGAGGFAFGIYSALAAGATHVWLMDDDGCPCDESCSANLLAAMERYNADVVSPIIVSSEDRSKLAFPYFIGMRRITSAEQARKEPIIRGFAHLFNGVLISADAFSRFGVPDNRLFIRGDEVDFMHRVRRGGGTIITLPAVRYAHPSGEPETVSLLGGRLHAVVPASTIKGFYFFRNRGYLLVRHRLVKQAFSDIVRYPWYYLIHRRGDWRGLRQWIRWGLRGMREDFTPPGPLQPSETDGLVAMRSAPPGIGTVSVPQPAGAKTEPSH